MRTSILRIAAAAVVLVLGPRTILAQEDHQHDHDADDLGVVHFPTSCRPDVADEFTRGVALLHSFGYAESRLAFESVARRDPGCAMAQWGIAMTYYHPIWSPPGPADLSAGKAAAGRAMDLGGEADREKGYIAAARAFYKDSETVDHGTRARAYRDAMESLARRFPDDHEATIFYAVAIMGTAPPNDPTYAVWKQAAAVLNPIIPLEPRHPGVVHYIIHAFDFPALASDALPAARAYAKIAPASPHALHMPSHIFTRLGLWQESIESNIASADAARRLVAKRHPGAASFDALHALDYLEYAYLQTGDQERARRVLEEAAAAKTFDEPQFAAVFAIAAIPARWALERRDWKAASEVPLPAADLPWGNYAYVPATTQFARALGAARAGRLDVARAALDEIAKIHAALVQKPIPGPYDWTSNVESLRLAGSAWLAFAEKRTDEALQTARAAAELDERTGKHPVTPGALIPPRELYADMLLEAGRPADAVVEYEAALRDAPNRFNGLHGAARAAELSGKTDRARELYAKLIAQCVEGSPRAELAQARAYLDKRGG